MTLTVYSSRVLQHQADQGRGSTTAAAANTVPQHTGYRTCVDYNISFRQVFCKTKVTPKDAERRSAAVVGR